MNQIPIPPRWYEVLRVERKRKKWNLDYVAKRLVKSISWVAQLERGEHAGNLVGVVRYCDLLGLNAHDLVMNDLRLNERLEQ